MDDLEHIVNRLPYKHPFLFVDTLISISSEGAEGTYTFKEDAYFYEGHFKNHPVTPGVILTECMAQIGVVCLGILLLNANDGTPSEEPKIAMSSSQVDYLLPVYPRETVRVVSEKEYFRFGKLKCKVKLYNSEGKIACQGVISGMIA